MKKYYSIPVTLKKIIVPDLQAGLMNVPFLKDYINSFLLFLHEENRKIMQVELYVELKASLSYLELEIIHSETARLILDEIKKLEGNFLAIFKSMANADKTSITFYSLGEGPFKAPGSYAKTKIAFK